jgi:hypothetical protein
MIEQPSSSAEVAPLLQTHALSVRPVGHCALASGAESESLLNVYIAVSILPDGSQRLR